MSSHLNLIGSIIIAGILMLMINRFSASMSQNSHENVLSGITNHNASSITQLIEYDFNKMGLRVTNYDEALKLIDSSRITFLGDINEDGAVDSIRYILSDVNAGSGTVNPRDKILYRLVNNQAQQDAALGVTRFRIRYFNSQGNLTANFAQIKTFEITLNVESIVPYDNRYVTFYWQTSITPPNLLRY